MGEVVEFRDYQSKAAQERARKALEESIAQGANQIALDAFPSVFGFDPNHYHAPKDDPA